MNENAIICCPGGCRRCTHTHDGHGALVTCSPSLSSLSFVLFRICRRAQAYGRSLTASQSSDSHSLSKKVSVCFCSQAEVEVHVPLLSSLCRVRCLLSQCTLNVLFGHSRETRFASLWLVKRHRRQCPGVSERECVSSASSSSSCRAS